MQKHENRGHALLSASSAKKWLNCTPSAVLTMGMKDESSDAAKEGTLAHEICELKLAKAFTEQSMTNRTYNTRYNELKKSEYYKDEMDGFTDDYVDYIQQIAYGQSLAPYIAVEKKIDYSAYVQDGSGTCDCIILYGNDMHVIDFKYGKGIEVSAQDGDTCNPQMGLYALGALTAYQFIYNIQNIHMHIVQPRIRNFSTHIMSSKDLVDWGTNYVKPRAELAYKGEGTCVQGEWCDKCFCKINATCRARAEANLDLLKHNQVLPPTLSDEEVGPILEQVKLLTDWTKKLEKYALSAIIDGKEIPGWKIVEGRSNRSISDTDKAFEELMAAGYKKAMLYESKPITLTQVETLIDKEDKDKILSKYIIKPQGKPSLAKVTDKRPAMQVKSTAEQDFGPVQ